jgi:hypothetical protein
VSLVISRVVMLRPTWIMCGNYIPTSMKAHIYLVSQYYFFRASPPFTPTVTPTGGGRGGSRYSCHRPPGNPKPTAVHAIQAALDGNLVCKFGTLQSLTLAVWQGFSRCSSQIWFLVALLGNPVQVPFWSLLSAYFPLLELVSAPPRISLCAGEKAKKGEEGEEGGRKAPLSGTPPSTWHVSRWRVCARARWKPARRLTVLRARPPPSLTTPRCHWGEWVAVLLQHIVLQGKEWV